MNSAVVPTRISSGLRLAHWVLNVQRSSLQVMLAEASRPGVLSMALGLPAAELFPKAAFARITQRVLREDPVSLQYTPPLETLRRQVVELMAIRGVQCMPEEVMITTGAQQGLSLLTRLLAEPRDSVLVEDLAYPGLMQALQPLNARIKTVPTSSQTGIDVDAVEAILQSGSVPAFLYVSSESHNPLGVTLRAEPRQRLTDLAQHYGMPIIEDDAYGFLQYQPICQAPMRALADEFVLYVGSFSKIVAPAIRVGWIVVPARVIPQLSILKEASDIDTSTLAQRILSRYITEETLPEHIEQLRCTYRLRRDALLDALNRYFGDLGTWNKPVAGVFVWLELNQDIDTTALLAHALSTEKVAYIPGQAFSADGKRRAVRCMRLSFSQLSPWMIEEAVARLARVVQTFQESRLIQIDESY